MPCKKAKAKAAAARAKANGIDLDAKAEEVEQHIAPTERVAKANKKHK